MIHTKVGEVEISVVFEEGEMTVWPVLISFRFSSWVKIILIFLWILDYQGSRRGKNDRGAGRLNQFSRDEGQWCHDKFLELEEVGKGGGGGGGSKNGHRSSRHSSRGSFASSHHSENNKMVM